MDDSLNQYHWTDGGPGDKAFDDDIFATPSSSSAAVCHLQQQQPPTAAHIRSSASETSDLALTLDDLFFTSGEQLEQRLLLQPPKYETNMMQQCDAPPPMHHGIPASYPVGGDFGIKEEAVSPEPMFGSMSGDSAIGTGDFDSSSLEIYRDLILKHLVQDISATCNKLAISSDPMNWSVEESALWLSDMSTQFQLDPPPHQLYLPGRMLATMSQEEFALRAPACGDTLHAQLQIWKTAAEYVLTSQESAASGSSPMEISLGSAATTMHRPSMMPSSTADPSVFGNTCLVGSDMSSYTAPTLSDWLSQFDPTNNSDSCGVAATPSTSSYLPQSAPARITGRKKGGCGGVFTTHGSSRNQISASNIQNNEHLSKLMPSPIGSDSGISADYDELCNDGSPTTTAFLKGRRHTVSCSAAGGGTTSSGGGSGTGNIHLWQFIRELLDRPDAFSACVRWLDRKEGVFKIENSHQLARLWGQRKNRTKMNYDKLSRSLRQYYKKNIIRKTGQRQRLIYQFIPPYHFA